MNAPQRIWDHILRHYPDKGWVSVNELEKSLALEKQGTDRATVVAFLKSCEEKGLGWFRNGRRGHPSRILWNKKPHEVGADVPFDTPANGGRGLPVRTVSVEVPVRPGVVAKLAVPEDLSSAEADRIIEFVKRLPLDTRSAA